MEEQQVTPIEELTLAAIYDGGAWHIGKGVTLTTTYQRRMHTFDWSIAVDGHMRDYGLDCEEPGFVITRAMRILEEQQAEHSPAGPAADGPAGAGRSGR